MHRKIWGKFGDEPTTSLKRVVQVKIPDLPALPNSHKIAKQIRKNILRDEFGFTDADIEEFDKKHPNILKIHNDAKPGQWATDQQFQQSKKYTPDKIISIAFDESAVIQIENFRAQRASYEAFKVGMFITDAAIKQDIVGDLENILNSSGVKRTDALDNLMITIAGSPSKHQFYQVIRFLLNESGYKDNPFLLIALAQASIYKSDTPAFGSNAVEQTLVADAVRATNERLYNNPRSTNIDKLDAAAINYWAGKLYSLSNAEDKSIERRWVERFQRMIKAEKDEYKAGDMIEEIPPGLKAMGTPSVTSREFDSGKEDRMKQLKLEDDIKKIGSENPPTDPKSSEYFQTSSDKLEMEDALTRQKNRQNKQGYVPKYRVVDVSTPVFRQANIKVDAVGAVLYLVSEILKYVAADRRMNDIADYYSKQRWIETQL